MVFYLKQIDLNLIATSVYSNSPPNTNPSFFNTGSSSPSPISTNSPNQAVFPENRARIPLDYGNPDIIHCECCAYDSLHRVYEFVPFYPPTFNVYSYKNAEIGRGGRTVPPIDNGIVYPGELLFTRYQFSFFLFNLAELKILMNSVKFKSSLYTC